MPRFAEMTGVGLLTGKSNCGSKNHVSFYDFLLPIRFSIRGIPLSCNGHAGVLLLHAMLESCQCDQYVVVGVLPSAWRQ